MSIWLTRFLSHDHLSMDETFWLEMLAAGPQYEQAGFDPYLTDDVLAAERATMQYDRRKSFVARYAWAIPSREAIRLIHGAIGSRKLLEVCAGNGLWSRLLSDAGVCTTATDGIAPGQGAYVQVEGLEAEIAVREHPGCRALFLCWPPFKDDCAFRALRAFQGDRVVYIGDDRFTADTRFHALLKSSWELLDQLPLPSWPGTSDGVHVYARPRSAGDAGQEERVPSAEP